MRNPLSGRVPKVVGRAGMALGIAIIAGSVVGGVALAATSEDPNVPAVQPDPSQGPTAVPSDDDADVDDADDVNGGDDNGDDDGDVDDSDVRGSADVDDDAYPDDEDSPSAPGTETTDDDTEPDDD